MRMSGFLGFFKERILSRDIRTKDFVLLASVSPSQAVVQVSLKESVYIFWSFLDLN